MPRIPQIQSRRKLVDGARTTSAQPRGPNVFEAAGLFLQQGAKLAGTVIDNEQNQKASSAVADFDYTKRMLERQNSAPAGGGDFYNETRSDYDTAVDDHVNAIDDDRVRQAVRTKLMSRKPGQLAAAARFEVKSRQDANRAEANTALNTVENRVRAGGDFDQALEDSIAVINSRNLPASAKEQMVTQERQRLSNLFFESEISNARSDADLTKLEDMLTDEQKWKSLMRPEDFDSTLDAIRTARKSVRAANKAAGVAAVSSLSERNTDGVAIPVEEMQQAEEMVKRSGDSNLISRFYSISAKQRVIRQESGVRARDIRSNMRKRDPMAGVPRALAGSIRKHANGSVSAGYLSTVARLEFGVHFAGDQTNFNQGNLGNTTSAHGPFQFTADTWKEFAPAGLRSVMTPVEISKLTPEKMLGLRGDTEAATAVAAHMTAIRRADAGKRLGRPLSDPETYLTHLLGVGGAVAVLKAVDRGENVTAEQALANVIGEERAAKWAANNKGLFMRGNTPRSAAGFVTNVIAKFDTAPGRFDHVRQEARQSLINKQRKALADDPMAYAAETGRLPGAQEPIDFNDTSTLATRGEAARAVSDYYEIPVEDMKPLTVDEAASLSKLVAEGTPEEVAGTLASLTALGPRMSVAAFRQIGEKDPVAAHAAGLIVHAGRPETGLSVIRGRKRMSEDKGIKAAAGLASPEARVQMSTLASGALSRLPPRSVAAAFDAAVALHVDRMALAGNMTGVFDAGEFDKSMQAVLGGDGSIDTVNGAPMLLPQGVTADRMEVALDSMQDADLAKVSSSGKPPSYADGSAVQAEDIADEGKLRAIGRGRYQVEMADGKILVTDIRSNGTAQPYVMVIDRGVVDGLVAGESSTVTEPVIGPSREMVQ